MQIKLFELRDSATFIPVMAIKLGAQGDVENFLLARSGYGKDAITQNGYIVMFALPGGLDKVTSDPYEWGNRTRQVSCDYIIRKWDLLNSGDVIDVQYILGETTAPKTSERLGNHE